MPIHLQTPRHHWLRSTIAACLLATCGLAWSQADTVVLKRSTEMRAQPSSSAASVATLPEQSTVTRLSSRQGAWIQVKTDKGVTGWVHLFDVGSANTGSSGGLAGTFRSIGNFFSKGLEPANSNTTATAGIRGMKAEDIDNAKPNTAALRQIEGLRSDAGQARRFANDSQLKPRSVDDLPAPSGTLNSSERGK
jgi:Bacterial SH3 domain